jgi:hypothetical protein
MEMMPFLLHEKHMLLMKGKEQMKIHISLKVGVVPPPTTTKISVNCPNILWLSLRFCV